MPRHLQVDLFTVKVAVGSRVMWPTSMPILVIGLSVLDLGPMYAIDVRRQTDRHKTSDARHRL